MTNQELLVKIDEKAREQTELFGNPSKLNYDTANKNAVLLARSIGADETLSEIGTRLMDIKLGECIKQGKQPEHINRSYEYTKSLLEEFGVNKRTKQILLDCVKFHHGAPGGKYPTKEAEVVANADCYRFIGYAGLYGNIMTTRSWGLSQNDSIDYLLSKLNEKRAVLSIKKAKADLEPIYTELVNLLNKCKIEK